MTDLHGGPEERVAGLEEASASPEPSAAPAGRSPEGPSPEGSPARDAAAAIAGLVEAAETEAVQAPIGLTEAGLEALLFVAEKPLTRKEIAQLAGVDRDEVDARLGDLEVSLRDRGLRLVVNAERVELATAPEAGRLIARYVGVDVVRLSPAALETLAIVAYRQPITRAAIERIRGVDSEYSVRTLLHRRLIVELGRSEAPGRPMLFGTGFEFLERFGLTSLDELPVLDSLTAERLTDEGAEAAAAADLSGASDSEADGAGAPDAADAADAAGFVAGADRDAGAGVAG